MEMPNHAPAMQFARGYLFLLLRQYSNYLRQYLFNTDCCYVVSSLTADAFGARRFVQLVDSVVRTCMDLHNCT